MSWALWITGPPGSGKSTIARAVVANLQATREPVYRLELDAIRKILTPAPSYSAAEREIVYHALVYLAAVLTGAGVPVVIDATAHRRAWRDLARAVIPTFAEVQLSCPLEVCVERERLRKPGHAPRDIYARAGRAASTVPGIDVPYEPALRPELVIDTATTDVEGATARVVALARDLARRSPARVARPEPPCAIWITGLPGSGKTTLAGAVADALTRKNVPVKVLDLASVEAILPGGSTHAGDEMAYRTLVCAAHLLTAHGISVIIDATGPRRAWRELAREHVDRFAEVQLLCPLPICGERERATRWRLGAAGSAAARPGTTATWPEIVLDYEHSINPDLIIRTDVQHVSSAARDVLRLAERLLHDAAPFANRRIS